MRRKGGGQYVDEIVSPSLLFDVLDGGHPFQNYLVVLYDKLKTVNCILLGAFYTSDYLLVIVLLYSLNIKMLGGH